MNVIKVDFEKAKSLRESGKTYSEISEIMGCSTSWCSVHLRHILPANKLKNVIEGMVDIEGYEGLYAVTRCGKVYSYRSDKVLADRMSGLGYNAVTLCGDDKNYYFVHRLVAQAFIPNPENKPTVNHKNGIKLDNRVENLEWATQAEQMRHAVDTGLNNVIGEENPSCVLTSEQVKEILWKYSNTKCSHKSLGDEYGVCHTTIGKIVRGDTWVSAGSQKETKKRRKDRGETHSQSVLTWQKVDEIRAKYAAGDYTMRSLGAEYGIHNGHVWAIIHKKSWKDEDRPLQFV